ncbi:MAG: FUSC family protein [Solirubrobacteraceae bacterium]
MFARISHRLRDPVTWAGASQIAKTALAAVVAWVLAVNVFHLAQAFMAPWAALLTVHATVYGTLRRGLQQAAASVLGVLIGFAAWEVFGLNAISLGAAVLAGLALGSVRGVRAETTTAATAVVVLTTGYIDKSGMLAARLADTGVGIVVGLLVNLVVWPPLRDRSAARQIDVIDDRIGELLAEIAARLQKGFATDDVDGWIARTDELDTEIDRAWSVIEEARESGRLNLRRAVPQRMQAAEGFVPIVNRLAQAVAETRSMARTIRIAHVPPDEWDDEFREPWLELLRRTGAAVVDADTGQVKAARDELRALANRLAVNELHDDLWPVYGALLVNLRNVLDALDVVAEAQPVQVASPSLL